MADDKKKSTPLPISAVLGQAFSGKPLELRLKEGKVWELWQKLVGEQIAKRAQPVSIRNGTLTICVSSGPWMQQLNFLKKNLIIKLNREIGEDLISEIFLKAGNPENISFDREPFTPATRDLTPEEQKAIAACVETINDHELRNILQMVMERHYRGKSDS